MQLQGIAQNAGTTLASDIYSAVQDYKNAQNEDARAAARNRITTKVLQLASRLSELVKLQKDIDKVDQLTTNNNRLRMLFLQGR